MIRNFCENINPDVRRKLEDLHKEVKDEEKGENSQEKINNLLYKQMVIGLEMNTGIIRNNNNPY
jgi:hypothetical protein